MKDNIETFNGNRIFPRGLLEKGIIDEETYNAIMNFDKPGNLEIIRNALGDSWLCAYGYDDEPFCDGGGWGSDDPYPFLDSNGLTEKSLYVDENDIDLNEYELVNDEGYGKSYYRQKNSNYSWYSYGDIKSDDYGRFYDPKKYPNPDDYRFVYINHIKT